MSDITIFVSEVTPVNNNNIRVGGLVYVSPGAGPYSFTCEHEWGEISVNINKSIRDMAVMAAEDNGHQVHPQDKKTIFCAAVDAQG